MLQLRPYQQKAIDLVYDYFREFAGNPVLELPTSAGKSLIQAAFIEGIFRQWPGQRVLCLAHVRELIEQNYLELAGYWQNAPAGINAAALGRRDLREPILFAMIQSVYKLALRIGHVDLVIVDECHLVPVKTSEGMYRKFFDELLRINPALKIIGLSATPYRLDNGLLTDGDNRVFTDIIPAKAIGASIDDLLDAGYLSPLVTPQGGIETRLDVTGVKKSGADYNQKQLAAAVDIDETTRAAVGEIVQHGHDRRSWLVFAASVAHAIHIADEIRAHGIEAEIVTGETPKAERAKITERFKAQQLRALVNVNVLTTGFNAPGVDLIAFLRPTHSTNIYVQMCGRGMRLSPATMKTDCLVLDFAGLIDKHGPVNAVTPPPRRGEGKGEAPIKECEGCFMIVPAGASRCPYCGYEFPAAPPKINEFASRSQILRRDPADLPPGVDTPERHEITSVTYSAHEKFGSPDSLRVDYFDGLNRVASEWVCLFHSGRAGAKGLQWWRDNVGVRHQPADILQAVELARIHAAEPEYIYTEQDGKFTRVISRGMKKTTEVA